MRGKIFAARYFSRVFLILLYALDIIVIFRLSGNPMYSLIGAILIPCIIGIQLALNLLTLNAHSIKNVTRDDAIYLKNCMDEVMKRSIAIGRKRINIRLYIADNDSLNAYTVGRNIVVNRSLLRLGDRSILEGILAHELSHAYNYDSFFKALLELNIFAVICLLTLVFFGTAIITVLIIVIIFGVVFSSCVGFTIGTFVGKLMKHFFRLFICVFNFVSRLFAAFLYRRQEFEADRFAVLLEYGRSMINFFTLEEHTEHSAIQTSWIENLLNDHPSNYRRIVQIERFEEKINIQESKSSYIQSFDNLFK